MQGVTRLDFLVLEDLEAAELPLLQGKERIAFSTLHEEVVLEEIACASPTHAVARAPNNSVAPGRILEKDASNIACVQKLRNSCAEKLWRQ